MKEDMTVEERLDHFEGIVEEISNCQKCPLSKERTNAIPGYGSFKADVMIIRDFPEFVEDKSNNVWSSPTSRLFEKILKAAHINIQKVYSTYLAHCRPRSNKLAAKNVKICLPYIEELMNVIDPKIVVLCGRVAVHRFLGVNKKVSACRGQFFEKEVKNVGKVLFYVINHPTTMVRFPLTKKKEMFDDLNVLFKKIMELKLIY